MLTVERSKRQIEAITVTADFSDRMAADDSIADASVTIEVFSGDDPSPEDMLYLPIIIDIQGVYQRVKQGVVGVIYDIQFVVTTAGGLVLDQTTRLAVLPTAPGAIPQFMPLYFTSRPYPLLAQEFLIVGSVPLGGELRNLIVQYTDSENIQVGALPISGSLRAIVIGYTDAADNIQVSSIPLDGSLRQILFSYTDSEEVILVSAEPRTGDLRQILIQYTSPAENILVSATPLTGTLS